MIAHHIYELLSLIGEPVLFLPCRPKEKRPIGKWKNLTAEAMNEPNYLLKLSKGNIGVALGPVSGDLVSLDIDADPDLEEFLKLNSAIANTLRSRGRRGGNVWWRMDGPYPPLSLLKRNGTGFGEWRADGAQTIIHGIHPEGMPYVITNRKPPLRITFSSIVFPPGVKPPSSKDGIVHIDTRHKTQNTETHTVGVGCRCVHSLKEVVEICVPQGPHNSHRLFSRMAGALLAYEKTTGNRVSDDDQLKCFEEWYKYSKAKKYLRDTQSKDEYLFEFMDACNSIKNPLGEDIITQAWKRAQLATIPPEAQSKNINHPNMCKLISLCRELQLINGDKPFFLSPRIVMSLMGHNSHSTAACWLGALCKYKILSLVEKGSATTFKASSYRFNFIKQ